MRKFKVFIIILGILLVALGTVIIIFTVSNHTYNRIKDVTNTFDINNEFDSFDIECVSSDIIIKYSDTEKCTVECYEKDKITHSVAVKDKKLTIKENDTRRWFEKYFFFYTFSRMRITINLPKSKTDYNNLDIKLTTGDLKIQNTLNTKNVTIKITTGNILFDKINSDKMSISSTTGDIVLNNVNIKGELNIESTTSDTLLTNVISDSIIVNLSTGDVVFKNSDAHSLLINSTTGDIEGSLLTAKKFVVHTTTGDINVPANADTTDVFEANTTTGDITITIVK